MRKSIRQRTHRTVRKPHSGSLRLELESKIEYIDFVHTMTEKLGKMAGLSQERSFQTGLAVREGLINAIRHGNQEKPDRKVTVDFVLEPGLFATRIRDQGEGFDYQEAPNPLEPENLFLSNGRGIFLMRNFVDSVRFQRVPQGGMEVELVQRISRVAGKKGSGPGGPVVPEFSEGGDGMKASVRKVGSVSVLDLAGKITIGAGDMILREAVNALLEEGDKNIVINLEQVSYMDSAGIGELVACRKRSNDLEGGVKLLRPSGKVADLLHLTKLEEIFDIFQDESEAVASFTA